MCVYVTACVVLLTSHSHMLPTITSSPPHRRVALVSGGERARPRQQQSVFGLWRQHVGASEVREGMLKGRVVFVCVYVSVCLYGCGCVCVRDYICVSLVLSSCGAGLGVPSESTATQSSSFTSHSPLSHHFHHLHYCQFVSIRKVFFRFSVTTFIPVPTIFITYGLCPLSAVSS